MAELIPEATIVQADVGSRMDLERENMASADAVVTMTGLDELNVILSLYATSIGVPTVITKLGRAENPEILDQLSIGSTVCPKELCTNAIIRYVRAMENSVDAALTVRSIADGQAEAIEFMVDEYTKHKGEPLKDINLKKNVLVASITRGKSLIFPKGDTKLLEGDHVVIIAGSESAIQQLIDIFAE